MSLMSAIGRQRNEISDILVGDELGQLKRIDVSTGHIRTINKHLIHDRPTPDQPILSIRGFEEASLKSPDIDVNDEDDIISMEGRARAAITNSDPSVLHLISQKPNRIYIYNSVTESFINLNVQVLCNHSNLVGAAPFERNNVVVCFENGNIYLVNIERELVQDHGSDACKASKVLGINSTLEQELMKRSTMSECGRKDTSVTEVNQEKSGKQKKGKSDKTDPKEQLFKPNPCFDYNPVTQLFKPEWKRDYIITCFGL
jgi:hypothetical protein